MDWSVAETGRERESEQASEREVQSTTCSPSWRDADPAHSPMSLMSDFLTGIGSEAIGSVFEFESFIRFDLYHYQGKLPGKFMRERKPIKGRKGFFF